MDTQHPHHQGHSHEHHHHILPNKVAFAVGGSLMFLTAVTVWIAHVDLGAFNFVIAMAVATLKASLVAMIFMNLWYDTKENSVIFLTSFLFLAIFIVLAGTDLFFRGDVYVKGPLVPTSSMKSKFKSPWVATPEIIANGKEVFQQQCISCHGPQGHGDGTAAASLNPRPRNFTQDQGWKNGRKPSEIFKTLKEGIPGSAMASFVTLPQDDRWSLAHYVNSLGPNPPKDGPADLAKAGIDPNKPGGGAEEAPTISVETAMRLIAVNDMPPVDRAPGGDGNIPNPNHPGASVYQMQCANCHGVQGEGGIRTRMLAAGTGAAVTTQPFIPSLESLRSQDKFTQVVIRGYPGSIMPGFGQLSGSQLSELYSYIKSLPAAR